VDRELLDHVLRLLRRAPTRCLPADVLLHAVRRDLRTEIAAGRFLDGLATAQEQLAILPALAGDRGVWSQAEAAAYDAATAAAGVSMAPLVMLRRLPPMPNAEPAGSAWRAEEEQADDRSPDDTQHALLEELHAGLAELLHAAPGDDALQAAVGGALSELEAARMRGPA
jgi:hypothetical protein